MGKSGVEMSVEVLGSTSNVPAPTEEQIQIDIPSLQLKLGALLPGDRQLERRARKLAWHLSRGRRVRCDWDSVSLSELTPAESRMSDERFSGSLHWTRQNHQPRKAEGQRNTGQPQPRERDMPSGSDDTRSASYCSQM